MTNKEYQKRRDEILYNVIMLNEVSEAEQLTNDDSYTDAQHDIDILVNEITQAFADYLHKAGYIDADYYTEEPRPVEEFQRKIVKGE